MSGEKEEEEAEEVESSGSSSSSSRRLSSPLYPGDGSPIFKKVTARRKLYGNNTFPGTTPHNRSILKHQINQFPPPP